MPKAHDLTFLIKGLFLAAIACMICIAFYQCYWTTHDLNWAFDTDFDRDMSFIRGALEGNFGKDPNYIGQYLWYNPLLFCIEAVIVKITGLPINIVVTRAGAYLNLLGPIAFVLMLWVMFNPKIAITGLLSFLFMASGKIPGWGAATYSPWLYPVCFVQFLFYLNILFLYLALTTQRYRWFFLLGTFTGISFLGHLGPTVLIVVIIALRMGSYIYRACREKDWTQVKIYFLQGLIMLIPFLIVATPLLFFVAGKYELRYVNRSPFELSVNILDPRYLGGMIKVNFSIPLLISILGLWWFYKRFHQRVIRKIILNWFLAALILYLYSSLIPILYEKFHISLPGTVPAFHYFFYLKSVQSVFFAFGLMYILKGPVQWISDQLKSRIPRLSSPSGDNWVYILFILICVAIYFPVYQGRKDFTELRKLALMKAGDKDKMEVYYFIIQHVPSDKVILCEPDVSIFPVMATARKMVSIASTFSNPFLSFDKRENDREKMLAWLVSGEPSAAGDLFKQYQVSYILLSLTESKRIKEGIGFPGKAIFKNNSYIIFSSAG